LGSLLLLTPTAPELTKVFQLVFDPKQNFAGTSVELAAVHSIELDGARTPGLEGLVMLARFDSCRAHNLHGFG